MYRYTCIHCVYPSFNKYIAFSFCSPSAPLPQLKCCASIEIPIKIVFHRIPFTLLYDSYTGFLLATIYFFSRVIVVVYSCCTLVLVLELLLHAVAVIRSRIHVQFFNFHTFHQTHTIIVFRIRSMTFHVSLSFCFVSSWNAMLYLNVYFIQCLYIWTFRMHFYLFT